MLTKLVPKSSAVEAVAVAETVEIEAAVAEAVAEDVIRSLTPRINLDKGRLESRHHGR
jgi:hypothetical protein